MKKKSFIFLKLSLVTTTGVALLPQEGQATIKPILQRPSAPLSASIANVHQYPNKNEAAQLQQAPNDSATASETAIYADIEASEDSPNRQASDPETIVVTGTNIRGAGKPVGGHLITIGQEDIQRSGFSSIRDLSEHLPQNFGSGATGEYQVNVDSANNNAAGSTFNLRGLGQTATLNLINGRRVPTGGSSASVSDISTVPMAAIERVEVLPDGASAVYGADAVAGVVNVILRSDFSGQETAARYGFTTQKDNLDEFQISHLMGTSWDGGNLLISYEFYHRDQLLKKDRPYAASRDLRNFGGGDYRIPFGSPGNILTPTGGLTVLYALPPDQNGQNLTSADLLPPTEINYYNYWAESTLFPRKRQSSLFGYLSQDVTGEVEIFIEGRYAHRTISELQSSPLLVTIIPQNNPYWFDAYGTGEPVRVAYSLDDAYVPKYKGKVNSYSAVFGANIFHPGGWMTRPYVAYSKDNVDVNYGSYSPEGVAEASNSSDPSTALNPFGNGPINGPGVISLIEDHGHDETKARTLQANIVSDGPLFSLFGQTLRGALGFDYRDEKFDRDAKNKTGPFAEITFKREVIAVFGELRAPIINEDNRSPGLESFDLSLSIRYDRYKDSARRPDPQKRPSQSTTNPRAGASWAPVEGLQFRGSYGTSFRAPQLETLSIIPSVSTASYEDPTSPKGESYVLLMSGVDPDIQSETADTWSVGADINPKFAPQARLQISYFNIDFKNQVAQPAAPSIMLSDPGFSDLVIRGPSLAQILAACKTAAPSRRPSDALACSTGAGIDAIIDSRTTNLARTKVDGVDINASYSIEAKTIGQILFSINSTILFNFEQAVTDQVSSIERKNTATYPVDFRARGSISWTPTDSSNLSLFVNYTNDYKDAILNKPVDNWITIDITATYNTNEFPSSPLLRNLSFQISVQNLFDEDPPFYDSFAAAGYDYANADPLGRFISFTARKKW